jgi:thymidine phosphorylase
MTKRQIGMMMSDTKPEHCLILKRIGIDTYREHVAYLHRDCPLYQTEGFRALSKLEIRADGQAILATLNIVEDDRLLGASELGLSTSAFEHFQLNELTPVTVRQPQPVNSMQAVRAKISGERLSQAEYNAICQDIVQGRYAKEELAAFLVSSAQSGMDREEVLFLTKAMTDSGQRLNWQETMVVDKHCIGGIPGNRTTMIITPIVAAYGLLIPKTSSRAITSPAGTADTMEVLANVDLPMEKLRSIVHEERGCLAWGGTANLAPVDDILISVERPLNLDSQGQMIASILSKKLAAGATHLLLDIPVGPHAKVSNMRDAIQLRKLFEYVGMHTGIQIEVVITDGRQPIGTGIGPVLEARDVMQVLSNDLKAPADLREKSLQLAGRILEFHPDVRGGNGYMLARDILESGRALEKMNRIIERQGKRPEIDLAELVINVKSDRSGRVSAIDNLVLARIAHIAGAPLNPGAGIDLHHKIDARVRKGEILYSVYTGFQANWQFVHQFLHEHGHGYHIS